MTNSKTAKTYIYFHMRSSQEQSNKKSIFVWLHM